MTIPPALGGQACHLKVQTTSHSHKRVKKFSDAKTSFTADDTAITKSPSFGVQMAINALRNSQVVVTEEKGARCEVRTSYPSELLLAFRAMFGAGKVYRFMLHSSNTLASSAGGVVGANFAWSPALSSFGEWTALAALFDEVRLNSSHLTWTTAFGPTSTAIIAQISLAPDFVNNGVTSTFTPITRLAQSIEFSIDKPGPAGASTLHRSARVPRGRLWAMTASTTSTTSDIGCNGQWSWASNIVTTVSINYAFIVVRNIVSLRCRA